MSIIILKNQIFENENKDTRIQETDRIKNISIFYLILPLFYSLVQVLVYFIVGKPSVNKLILWYAYYYLVLNLWSAYLLSLFNFINYI